MKMIILKNLHNYIVSPRCRKKTEVFWALANSLFTAITYNSCGKSDELECDISAIYLLDEAGYDSELALGGVELLERVSQPKSDAFWDELFFAVFASHPWSEDRAKCVKGYVRGSKVKVQCEQIFENTFGKVVTRTDPLGIRKYPIKKSETLHKIPRHASISVLCDCIEQEHRTSTDFYYVSYDTPEGETYKGWVDKKYVEIMVDN